MRNAFAEEVLELAKADPRIILLSGDIGNRLFDSYKSLFPDRFINCGIAEANMIGVAAGLAQAGYRPIAYTIAPFLTYRCFEQIRVDLGYHHLPVVLVGTGSGLSYASLGATHHSCEDMGVMRTIPGMNVLAPCDALELRALLRVVMEQENPTYMRIGKKGEPSVYEALPPVSLGRANILREGSDVSLLVAGNLMPSALEVAEKLDEAFGVSVEVVSFHSVKPMDTDCLRRIQRTFKAVITLEEHSLIGGLGSAVAEWIIDSGCGLPCLRLGCSDSFIHKTTEQESARAMNRLDVKSLVERIRGFAERVS